MCTWKILFCHATDCRVSLARGRRDYRHELYFYSVFQHLFLGRLSVIVDTYVELLRNSGCFHFHDHVMFATHPIFYNTKKL